MKLHRFADWKEIEKESKPFITDFVTPLVNEATKALSRNAGRNKTCKHCLYCEHGRNCLLTYEQRIGMKACYRARNIRLLKEHEIYGQKTNIQTSAH